MLGCMAGRWAGILTILRIFTAGIVRIALLTTKDNGDSRSRGLECHYSRLYAGGYRAGLSYGREARLRAQTSAAQRV
jgi:hypothetical protein